MALTLECVCGPNVSLCNPIDLTWMVDVSIEQHGTMGATGFLKIEPSPGAGGPSMAGFGAGHYEFPLTPMSSWTNPIATFTIDASLFQVNIGSITIAIADHIRQRYQCINAMTGAIVIKEVIANGTFMSFGECVTGPRDIRSICTGLTGTMFKSTPLGACNGCTSTESGYSPPPNLDVTINLDDSGSVCLCAAGGTGDYTYSIVSGNLPCGQSLNAANGCIQGQPDGSCDGTPSVTFRVTDAGGGAGPPATAEVTCGFVVAGCVTTNPDSRGNFSA